MKKYIYPILCGLLGLSLTAQAQQMPAHRECATMEVLAAQIAADPSLATRLQAIDQQAAAYAAKKAANPTQRTTLEAFVTIPVVVHVLHNTDAQDITDEQVQSQIKVLNDDFHKLNTDLSKVPAAFAPLIGDAGVQFVLAKQDPSGKATTGIVHKSTPALSFDSSDKMKYSSSGGDDAWPAASYLNLWCCNLGGGLLGYAQFPGGAPATDGVVILYSAFGSGGSAVKPYDLGRTATHEVGHWLNLRHIWGDARCGNDQVADTPTQQTSNYGCPTFPHVTCSNGANGDMFMNYMDYTDDACMQMFSSAQGDRMDALFASGGTRASLLTSVGGLAPGSSAPAPTTPTTPTPLAYCESKGNAAAQFIDYVKLGSLSRTSGNDGGYYNGTALSASVATGSGQTLSFSAGYASKATTVYFNAYADWNQDGVFDANETLVSAAGSTSKTTRTATFTVPATAKTGSTRLRVVMSTNSATTSCGTTYTGETEDYTLNVTGGAARLAAAPAYTLYPNPAADVLNIERPASVDAAASLTVRVYDLRGAEVRGAVLTDNQLRLTGLSQGVYLLSISDGSSTAHQRFVKE